MNNNPNGHSQIHEREIVVGLSSIDFDQVRVIESTPMQEAGSPVRGDIWWTASSYEGPAGYEGLDRMPFLILGESEEADQKWIDATPIWHDVDLANEFDLVLNPEDSTLSVPLRVQLRREITLAFEQFNDKLGEVRAEGMALVDAAIRGEAGLEHFGIPYEGANDWRLGADRWAAELVETLQGPYFATLAQAEEAVLAAQGEAPAGDIAPLFLLFDAKLKEVALADHEFALAAASDAKRPVVELHATEASLFAYLWANALQDVLELHIKQIAEEWLGELELLVGLKGGRTVCSGPFVPKPGLKIAFAKGEAITPKSIDLGEIKARVHPE